MLTFVYGLVTGAALATAGAYFYGKAVVTDLKNLVGVAYGDIERLKDDVAQAVAKLKAAV